MPGHAYSSSSSQSYTAPVVADRLDRQSGPGNGAMQDRLRTGDGVGTGDELDAWGAAVTEETSILAPYLVEIEEGQVAVPGQQDGVVTWMQAALQRLGYPAQQSGVFDPGTVAALTEWQRLNDVGESGTFGPTSLDVMDRAIEASFNFQQFQENAPGVPEATLREYLPHLNAAMLRANINTDARKAVFIAQLGHESDGFNTLEEYASGRNYEGRTDLGNIHPGDGRRFKGRGPIQITGRDNYTSYGQAIGVDLVQDPEIAATTEVGFRLAAEYWTRNDLNGPTDRGQFNTVTQRINGGQNGADDRRRRWRRAQRTLASWDATPDIVLRPQQRPGDLDTSPIEGGGEGPRIRPSTETGPVDGVLQLIAAGRTADAVTEAERLASAMQAEGDATAVTTASRARDIARALLDAQEAFDADQFGASKQAAARAASTTRTLRDSGLVDGNLADPVIALAGQQWSRANVADRARGRGADLALVEAAAPLRQGDRGDAVAALQRLLGMDVAGGAGTFGPQTQRAVLRFQSEHGLTADGIVGAGTIRELAR